MSVLNLICSPSLLCYVIQKSFHRHYSYGDEVSCHSSPVRLERIKPGILSSMSPPRQVHSPLPTHPHIFMSECYLVIHLHREEPSSYDAVSTVSEACHNMLVV